ncbi:MAG: hypothetical protein KatS3mg049_1921 [Caldilinea sp.]|nr:MAG: hypothetical protein KatS3mg049_1921 [Caldilinea sp.]
MTRAFLARRISCGFKLRLFNPDDYVLGNTCLVTVRVNG